MSALASPFPLPSSPPPRRPRPLSFLAHAPGSRCGCLPIAVACLPATRLHVIAASRVASRSRHGCLARGDRQPRWRGVGARFGAFATHQRRRRASEFGRRCRPNASPERAVAGGAASAGQGRTYAARARRGDSHGDENGPCITAFIACCFQYPCHRTRRDVGVTRVVSHLIWYSATNPAGIHRYVCCCIFTPRPQRICHHAASIHAAGSPWQRGH